MGHRESVLQAPSAQQGVTEIVKIANRGHALTIDGGWREVADTALAFVRDHGPKGEAAESSGVRIPVARLGIDLLHDVHPDAGRVSESESPLTPRFVS